MEGAVYLGRTEKGQTEILQGGKSLRWKLRAVLFFVDATKTAAEVERHIRMIDAPPDAIDQLVALGHIETVGYAPPPPAPPAATPDSRIAHFRVAKAFMNEAIVDALGIMALRFTLKLERCAAAEDLIGLLPAYTEALQKKLNREVARALVEHTHGLLLAARA
jgi:hypothetical protein